MKLKELTEYIEKQLETLNEEKEALSEHADKHRIDKFDSDMAIKKAKLAIHKDLRSLAPNKFSLALNKLKMAKDPKTKTDTAITAALQEYGDTHRVSLMKNMLRVHVHKHKIANTQKKLDEANKKHTEAFNEVRKVELFIEALEKIQKIEKKLGSEDINFGSKKYGITESIGEIADDIMRHMLAAEQKVDKSRFKELVTELIPFFSPEMKERLIFRIGVVEETPGLNKKFMSLLDNYVANGNTHQFSKGLDTFEKELTHYADKKSASAERRVASQIFDNEPKTGGSIGNASNKPYAPVIKEIEALKHYCEKKGKKDKSYEKVVKLADQLIKDVQDFGKKIGKDKDVTRRFMTKIKNRLHTLDDTYKHKDPLLHSLRQKILAVLESVWKKVGMLNPERQQKLHFWSSTKSEKGVHRIDRALDNHIHHSAPKKP